MLLGSLLLGTKLFTNFICILYTFHLNSGVLFLIGQLEFFCNGSVLLQAWEGRAYDYCMENLKNMGYPVDGLAFDPDLVTSSSLHNFKSL